MMLICFGACSRDQLFRRYYFEKFKVKQERKRSCHRCFTNFKQVSVHRQRHCHVSWQDDLVDFLQRIRKAYVEGLCWVLVYYYQAGPTQASTCDCDTVAPFVSFCQGCPSWTWFYPYHYALETRGPMGVAGDHLVCDSLCFTFRDFRPFRSEAICFRLDWLWQPEVRRDQLFPVSWLGICMRGSTPL